MRDSDKPFVNHRAYLKVLRTDPQFALWAQEIEALDAAVEMFSRLLSEQELQESDAHVAYLLELRK